MRKTVTEVSFGEYKESDKSVTLRNSSASIGGGSEVLVICSTRTPSEHCAKMITRGQTDSMSSKES